MRNPSPSLASDLRRDRSAPSPADEHSGPRASENARADDVFPLVCQHVARLVGRGSSDFDDLVQIASERALTALSGFEGRSSLSTWVFRICYTSLLQHRRWHKRLVKRITLATDGALPEGEPEKLADSLEVAEKRRRLVRALERLSPKLAVVDVLHDLRGEHVSEIAKELDLPELTVRSRLRDGRRRLAERLAKDPYFCDFRRLRDDGPPARAGPAVRPLRREVS